MRQQERFKPSSRQNWESGSRYREELANKARQRMEMLNTLKKTSFRSPFSKTRHVGMSTGQPFADGKHISKTVDSPSPPKNQAQKTSKAFHLYQQMH